MPVGVRTARATVCAGLGIDRSGRRAFAFWWGFFGGPCTVARPPRLSIVVLPFANIGGDPEQEYFVNGVTESLTTDLSRVAGSFVIVRNTAFSYKGKSPDVRHVGSRESAC